MPAILLRAPPSFQTMRHLCPLFQIISQIMSLVAHGFGRVVYFRNRIKELAYFLFQMTLMFA